MVLLRLGSIFDHGDLRPSGDAILEQTTPMITVEDLVISSAPDMSQASGQPYQPHQTIDSLGAQSRRATAQVFVELAELSVRFNAVLVFRLSNSESDLEFLRAATVILQLLLR
jgi:hypothetical protein